MPETAPAARRRQDRRSEGVVRVSRPGPPVPGREETMKTIYVDNNATTQVAPEVYRAMVPFLTEQYFNPSSMYAPAQKTANALAAARARIAQHFGGVRPDEIVFTSCATESNNMGIQGAAKASPNRRHVITTSVEHPAVLEVCKDLQRRGYEVTFLPVDRQGNLDLADFIRALRPDTLLVSIMHANNETGVIFPVEQLPGLPRRPTRTSSFFGATQSVDAADNLAIDMRYRHAVFFGPQAVRAGVGGLNVAARAGPPF